MSPARSRSHAATEYDPVTISESEGIRYLHFGSEWVQGAMRIRRPFDLEIDYTRDMMAWEGFIEAPEHIVQLGLGAASLTKYCWRQYPKARITAVELNPQVIACARQFFKLPADDDRLSVVQADAWEWIAHPRRKASIDALQVDLYDATASGPVYDGEDFYAACRKALAPGGVMTVNVFGRGWGFEDSFAAVFAAFSGRCEALDPVDAGNRIIVAQKLPA
ncbi:methyltransferase domain-containing protein [Piscinibacterium candidicorallinum]|uniref:Methyltransferase domain-containing protein n=1 Tax=Piscinibacterium candidicorallinum TaxID=1793872 RepID=A0ABV7GZN9_9BURK